MTRMDSNSNNMNTNGVFSGRQQPQINELQESQPQVGQSQTEQLQINQPQMCQPSPEVLTQQSQAKKPGFAKKIFCGIVFSFIILGFFMGVQYALMYIVVIFMTISYALQAGMEADLDIITEKVQNTVLESNFLTGMTAVLTAVSAVLAVLFYWLIWGRKKTTEDKKYFKEKVLKAKTFAMISIASVGLYYLAAIIATVIDLVSPQTMQEYSEMMDMALGGSIVFAMLAAVILAPINEECIMRGLILKNLQKYFSDTTVIIIQAILFGIFHMNWVQGIYVLPVGAALGFVAVKSRSVIPCIYMHLFYNLMSFVLSCLPVFFQTGFFSVIAVVASAGIVWSMSKEEKLKAQCK